MRYQTLGRTGLEVSVAQFTPPSSETIGPTPEIVPPPEKSESPSPLPT